MATTTQDGGLFGSKRPRIDGINLTSNIYSEGRPRDFSLNGGFITRNPDNGEIYTQITIGAFKDESPSFYMPGFFLFNVPVKKRPTVTTTGYSVFTIQNLNIMLYHLSCKFQLKNEGIEDKDIHTHLPSLMEFVKGIPFEGNQGQTEIELYNSIVSQFSYLGVYGSMNTGIDTLKQSLRFIDVSVKTKGMIQVPNLWPNCRVGDSLFFVFNVVPIQDIKNKDPQNGQREHSNLSQQIVALRQKMRQFQNNNQQPNLDPVLNALVQNPQLLTNAVQMNTICSSSEDMTKNVAIDKRKTKGLLTNNNNATDPLMIYVGRVHHLYGQCTEDIKNDALGVYQNYSALEKISRLDVYLDIEYKDYPLLS